MRFTQYMVRKKTRSHKSIWEGRYFGVSGTEHLGMFGVDLYCGRIIL
jgi:hypothetical protein